MIEHNPKELAAMEEFHKGNRQKGLELQEEFARSLSGRIPGEGHCPCKKACRYHGNCKECVAIHRAHRTRSHCMRPILNQKIKLLSQLTDTPLPKKSSRLKKFCEKNFCDFPHRSMPV